MIEIVYDVPTTIIITIVWSIACLMIGYVLGKIKQGENTK